MALAHQIDAAPWSCSSSTVVIHDLLRELSLFGRCSKRMPATTRPPNKARDQTSVRKLGKADRWPSDYGERDRQKASAGKKDARTWVPGEKGSGREGRNKGYGGSAGKGTGPSGPEKK
jgi:hypothetical protein